MPFRKYIQFVVALVLGFVLSLISYPAHSQDFPSFDNCFQEVQNYPRRQDLNRYSERQVYCLFVVELINGGVQVDKEYYLSELFGVLMNALRDTGDTQDDKLTYKQITDTFPGNTLNRLINESLNAAENRFSLSQSIPFQVAGARIPSHKSQSSSALASGLFQSRGGTAVEEVSDRASKGRRIVFFTR